MMHFLELPSEHPVQLAADIVTGAAGTAYLAASALSVIDTGERIILGALMIVLVALRIRSHLRQDAGEK